ncbi:MAG TPA: hypothetical protein VLH56_18895 [Dissulfurispiraceae bacterium]|nr:hypothetical protein [Dissulfurispiraceae bacterium]
MPAFIGAVAVFPVILNVSAMLNVGAAPPLDVISLAVPVTPVTGLIAHVRFPLASMAVAVAPAPQSVGFAASAVAVDAFPVNAAETVPAVKFPLPSRCTIALAVLRFVAGIQASATPAAVMPPATLPAAQLAGSAASAVAVATLPSVAATVRSVPPGTLHTGTPVDALNPSAVFPAVGSAMVPASHLPTIPNGVELVLSRAPVAGFTSHRLCCVARPVEPAATGIAPAVVNSEACVSAVGDPAPPCKVHVFVAVQP